MNPCLGAHIDGRPARDRITVLKKEADKEEAISRRVSGTLENITERSNLMEDLKEILDNLKENKEKKKDHEKTKRDQDELDASALKEMAMQRRKRASSETSSSGIDLEEQPRKLKKIENAQNSQIDQVLSYLQTESDIDKSTQQYFANQQKEWELARARADAELQLRKDELQARKEAISLEKRKLDLEEKKAQAEINQRDAQNKLMMQMMSKFMKE